MLDRTRYPVSQYLYALLICAATALLCFPLSHVIDQANIVMLLLLAVAIVAAWLGKGPAVAAAFLNVALFDFFFVTPRFSFAVADTQYLITFAVMLAVALIIGHLSDVVKKAVYESRQRELQVETERLRNAMLSALSHDLRTPLTVLCGMTETLLLMKDKLPREATGMLETLRNHAFRLEKMVSNLLEMARLESGTIEPRREWQPIEEVIGSSIRLLGETLAGHPIRVTLPNNMPLVNIDAILLERVFCNLLENACKYSTDHAAISVSASLAPGEACIVVHNEGPGFPPGSEATLFEPFRRGQDHNSSNSSSSSTNSGSGFGMGLTICHSIVSLHGGTITAFNPPGGGASVRFTLPLGSPPTLAVAATEQGLPS